jgi:hypothetical protein
MKLSPPPKWALILEWTSKVSWPRRERMGLARPGCIQRKMQVFPLQKLPKKALDYSTKVLSSFFFTGALRSSTYCGSPFL